jgi:hypothetical protein
VGVAFVSGDIPGKVVDVKTPDNEYHQEGGGKEYITHQKP